MCTCQSIFALNVTPSFSRDFTSDKWDSDGLKEHINYLEYQSIYLIILDFLHIEKCISFRCDNIPALYYFNKIGGTVKPRNKRYPNVRNSYCAIFFRSSFPITRIIAALTPHVRMFLNSIYLQLRPHKIFSNVLYYLIH